MILKHMTRVNELVSEEISAREAHALLKLDLVYVESGMGDYREFMPIIDYDLCKAVIRHTRQHAMLETQTWFRGL